MNDQRAKRRNGSTATHEQTQVALAPHWPTLGDHDADHRVHHEELAVVFPRTDEWIVGAANLGALRAAHPTRGTSTPRRIRGGGPFWVASDILADDAVGS